MQWWFGRVKEVVELDVEDGVKLANSEWALGKHSTGMEM